MAKKITTEEFDSEGNLVKRTIEETDEQETGFFDPPVWIDPRYWHHGSWSWDQPVPGQITNVRG